MAYPNKLGWLRRRLWRKVISMETDITTTVDEISDGIHRISTFLPEGPPGGITYNQFLLVGDEPLLFHTGTRRLFGAVRAAVATVLDPSSIAWISSGHASRPDEYGSLAEWEQCAPSARVAHGLTGCFLCLSDISSRPVRPLSESDIIEVGSHRLAWIDTPHVPGPWEAGVLFDHSSGTLFCGDLFSRTGPSPATTAGDIVDAAVAHDVLMHGHAYTPSTGSTLRRLAELRPRRLALMHGPTYVGDGVAQLLGLADYFDSRLRAA